MYLFEKPVAVDLPQPPNVKFVVGKTYPVSIYPFTPSRVNAFPFCPATPDVTPPEDVAVRAFNVESNTVVVALAPK